MQRTFCRLFYCGYKTRLVSWLLLLRLARNEKEWLNDIHILDCATSTWTCPNVGGVLPHPRVGMTLTALRERFYLFGDSGSSSKCFQDLQILDQKQMVRTCNLHL